MRIRIKTKRSSVNKNNILQKDHETVIGKIIYLSEKQDRKGQERGREYFIINKHANDHRKIVAHCEIDDRPAVMRDITYSLDQNWLPLDCFVRISVDDKFMGTGWFNFGEDFAECEVITTPEGRLSKKIQTNGRLKTFQNHAIACDAWHLRLYDRNKNNGPQNIGEVVLSSPDHRGATGPMLFSITMAINFVGEETVTVKAGTFDALHFQFVGTPGLPEEHPPYDIWCTNDGEYLFLKGAVGGYMQTYYELVELSKS